MLFPLNFVLYSAFAHIILISISSDMRNTVIVHIRANYLFYVHAFWCTLITIIFFSRIHFVLKSIFLLFRKKANKKGERCLTNFSDFFSFWRSLFAVLFCIHKMNSHGVRNNGNKWKTPLRTRYVDYFANILFLLCQTGGQKKKFNSLVFIAFITNGTERAAFFLHYFCVLFL